MYYMGLTKNEEQVWAESGCTEQLLHVLSRTVIGTSMQHCNSHSVACQTGSERRRFWNLPSFHWNM